MISFPLVRIFILSIKTAFSLSILFDLSIIKSLRNSLKISSLSFSDTVPRALNTDCAILPPRSCGTHQIARNVVRSDSPPLHRPTSVRGRGHHHACPVLCCQKAGGKDLPPVVSLAPPDTQKWMGSSQFRRTPTRQ